MAVWVINIGIRVQATNKNPLAHFQLLWLQFLCFVAKKDLSRD